MGMIKNDINDVVGALIHSEGRDAGKVATRLIEAGMCILHEDCGGLTSDVRFIPDFNKHGGFVSYHTARRRDATPPELTDIQHLKLAFGQMTIKPHDSFIVVIDQEGELSSIEHLKTPWRVTMGEAATFKEADMTAILKEAGETFGGYAQNHLDKSPPQHAKARRNMEMAAKCYEAIGLDYVPPHMPEIPAELAEGAASAMIPGDFDVMTAQTAGDHTIVVTDVSGLPGSSVSITESALIAAIRREPSLFGRIMGLDGAENGSLSPVEAIPEPLSGDGTPALSVGPDRAEIVGWIAEKARLAMLAGDKHLSITLGAIADELRQHLEERPIDMHAALHQFYRDVHLRNVKAGWWNDLATGKLKKRSVGELFILFVTEIAEAYDAYLENARDDKLPLYPGIGVELGDLQIRLADFMGALIEGNIVEYSATRNPGALMFDEVCAIAERYEAIRKTPEAIGEEELGDFISMMDPARMVLDKMEYNATRADHKPENRMKEDGKRT